MNVSVEENTRKEVKEEAGLDIRVKRIIAVQDREKHNLPIYAYKVCKIFMQCEVIGGEFVSNIETTGFDYFSIDELPCLAEEKNNREQIEMILSRLVDTFFSRISLTMPPAPKSHNTAYVLPWEEPLHWQSRSSGYSSS